MKKLPPPDRLAKARALTETSQMPIAEIARMCGLQARTVSLHAKQENWVRPPKALSRQQMVERLWQSAGQNLESIEQQLREGETTAALRDLSLLTKVMRDLMALDGEAEPQPPARALNLAQTRAAIDKRLERMRALDA